MLRILIIPAIILLYTIIGIILLSIVSKVFKHSLFIYYTSWDKCVNGSMAFIIVWPIILIGSLLDTWGHWVLKNGSVEENDR